LFTKAEIKENEEMGILEELNISKELMEVDEDGVIYVNKDIPLSTLNIIVDKLNDRLFEAELDKEIPIEAGAEFIVCGAEISVFDFEVRLEKQVDEHTFTNDTIGVVEFLHHDEEKEGMYSYVYTITSPMSKEISQETWEQMRDNIADLIISMF
jgi:hypothetical protein